MIKKSLVMVLAVLAVFALTTPSIMFAHASKKEVVHFSYTASSGGGTSGEVNVNWTPDWSVRIARGTWRLSNYNGPLGTGTLYSVAIISITHYDNETVGYTTYHGHGNYRYLYTITSGPYGAGTLEGVSIQEWDYDSTRTGIKNSIWGNGTFQHGTGKLEGVRMVYSFKMGTYTGEIILP